MNLALLHEAIARVIPDVDCIVWRDRRLSWQLVTERTRRLAALLTSYNFGCRVDRENLKNWESGQDHLGIYLRNGNEYLESMLGAFKARVVPFNVNYRYVSDELLYLFDNADASVVIFHSEFAANIERIKDRLPKIKLWLQVQDDSGVPIQPWAFEYEQAILSVDSEVLCKAWSSDDLYMIYTGGTTGLPKGVLWRQEDIFYSAMTKRIQRCSIEDIVSDITEHHLSAKPPIAMPAPPFMHSTAQWVAFSVWYMGGTVVIQDDVQKLNPTKIWSTIEREQVNSITIVGDAFAVPLLDDLVVNDYDLSSLKMIASGGAIWSATKKEQFKKLIPHVLLLDALGSSETGAQASNVTRSFESLESNGFVLQPGSVVLSENLQRVLPKKSGENQGETEKGWLGRRGWVPLGYYNEETKTEKTFPLLGGVRYSVPGDRACWNQDGTIELLGRDSVTIISGGEKIFAEEVEHAIKHHDDVYDVVVCGLPSERWGQQVTAIVKLRDTCTVSASDIKTVAAKTIAAYKLPKIIIFTDFIERAPSGKPDYRWAKQSAEKWALNQDK